MSNRQEAITSFLKIAYQYKNQFKSYDLLKMYNVDNNDVNSSYESFFSYWINYYQNNPNVNIGYDNANKGFLQIQNNTNTQDIDFIKLYINVSSHGFFNSVSHLIEYLSKHPEINHISKASQNRRSDQIVLRVRNMDEVINLINLINNDSTIQNDLRDANPFLTHCGKIGIAYDYMLSYNSFISYLIDEYLKTKNDINSIDADDFYKYLEQFYTDLFSYSNFDTYLEFTNSEEFISSYQHLRSIKPSTTFNEAILTHVELIDQFLKMYKENDDLNIFDSFHQYARTDSYRNERISALEYKHYLLDVKYTLDEYIRYVYSVKGESPENIENRILGFIQNRDSSNNDSVERAYRLITKDNNYREMFINKITSESISVLVPGNDILKYVNNVLRESHMLEDYDKKIS